MSGMKFLKDTAIQKFSLINLLHQSIGDFEEGRSMEKVHGSALTWDKKRFCPREYALVYHLKIPPEKQFVGTALRVTFNHGNNLQRDLNEKYLKDSMVGDWECRSCGKTRGMCKKPKLDQCGQINCNWGYHEVRAESEYSGVTCGLDVLLSMGGKKLKLVEVKTMDKDEFRDLVAPKAEHRVRTNLYMRCIDEDKNLAGKINTTKATVLYVSKSFGFKAETPCLPCGHKDAPFSPFKEFEVTRNDDSIADMVESARSYHLWKTQGGALPDGICDKVTCKRANQCLVAKECFSGKYAGVTCG